MPLMAVLLGESSGSSELVMDHERLEQLIRDLLTLARHDSGVSPPTEPIDLGPLLRSVVRRRQVPEGPPRAGPHRAGRHRAGTCRGCDFDHVDGRESASCFRNVSLRPMSGVERCVHAMTVPDENSRNSPPLGLPWPRGKLRRKTGKAETYWDPRGGLHLDRASCSERAVTVERQHNPE